MTVQAEFGWVRPDNKLLILVVCLSLVLLIGLPALFSIKWMALVGPVLLGICFILFSVQRTLLVLLLLNIVLPVKVLTKLRLPGGFQLQETLFLVALAFALIELIHRRSLTIRSSSADLPVLVFFLAILSSTVVGLARDTPFSLVLYDVRFPLYYMVFFLVTNFVDAKTALRIFLVVFALAGLIVSVEYILEFLDAIDLSVGTRFVRVARLQGIILPIALLFIINQFIYDPRRYGRLVLLGLLLPIGLAFVLTVGRGMWVAFGIGLITIACLHYYNQPTGRRSPWRTLLLILAILVVLGATVALFQGLTGTAVDAHVLERSRTFVDYQRDLHVLGRLISYSNALQAIAQHPFLGNGLGSSLTFPTFNPSKGRFEIWTTWSLDSLYLMLLWKMGLVGLVAAAWLGLRMLRLSYRTFRHTDDPSGRAFASGATAVLMAMYTLGLSDGSMINGRFALVHGILFGMIAVVASGRMPAPAAANLAEK